MKSTPVAATARADSQRESTAGLEANGGVQLVANRHGLTHLIGREVVDQHLIGSRGNRFAQPVERIDLDLDRDGGFEFTHPPIGLGDATRGSDVVVLDERHVRQAHPVVHTAAATDCVLLQRPQTRSRLAGVADHR